MTVSTGKQACSLCAAALVGNAARTHYMIKGDDRLWSLQNKQQIMTDLHSNDIWYCI